MEAPWKAMEASAKVREVIFFQKKYFQLFKKSYFCNFDSMLVFSALYKLYHSWDADELWNIQ